MAKKKGVSKAFSKALADGRKPKATAKRDKSPTLRDIVRAADKEGCHVTFSMPPRGSTRYEIAPGRSVSIQPVAGEQKVFDTDVGQGKRVRVEIMLNVEGELIFELTLNGRVLGTELLADHLRIV